MGGRTCICTVLRKSEQNAAKQERFQKDWLQ